MLTLWYIILGWKEYNKPFRKVEEPPKPAEPAKKPDLIPLKKDGPPTKPTDIRTPDPPASIPINPPPSRPYEPPSFNNKPIQPPKVPEPKITPQTPPTPPTPKTPATPATPKLTDPFKPSPRTPDSPKLTDPFKPSPRTPDSPKTTPETPKLADFRLAPEPPKKPDTPKTIPSPSPEASVPSPLFPSKNPAYVPPPSQAEFPLPPYLAGPPQGKPTGRDDELLAMGKPFPSGGTNKPPSDLRDLSYAKGEFPGEETVVKVKETLTRIPKYMEQSVISNPDSLESDEEDEDF